ncbi:hypothetical protein [Vibrio splendidus]|uniref:hypothetical protein n=1 Tax=Vibrio splendidus TaxID=29497 RepID=UPI000319935A|nr:hypothetical protein [Vibrio splendidus]OEE51944.1 hypothetical protein A146_21120 [Vibrio splendidus FF-500]
MSILLTPHNWGNARTVDLQAVLDSVVCVMNKYFESDANSDVLVIHNATHGPRVLFDRGQNNEYQVLLSSKDRTWDQHAYQFAHEYCHIRTNYSNGSRKVKWFEETICELASLFVLRRMSEMWQENPPYENWRDYSQNLYKYAENRIVDESHRLPEGIDFQSWFVARLDDLENNQYMRDINTTIAIMLLPLFEENPQLWRAISYLNTWVCADTDDIYKFFDKWLAALPDDLKPHALNIVELFGKKT